MKVRIVSDGSPMGTRIVNAETGEPLENVRSLEIIAEPEDVVKVRLTLLLTEFDIIADAQVLTVCPQCKRDNLYSGPAMERRIDTRTHQDMATYLPTCEHEEY